jgi:hypothetical protein
MEITLKIPEDQEARVIEAICALYPIPTVAILEGDTGKLGETEPEFRPEEWVPEKLNRFIVDAVQMYEQQRAAKSVDPDTSVTEKVAK